MRLFHVFGFIAVFAVGCVAPATQPAAPQEPPYTLVDEGHMRVRADLWPRLATARAALPALDRAADDARSALARGDIDGPAYAAFESARIAAHVEVDGLRQSIEEGRLALLTLLGGDFPPDESRKSTP